MSTARFVGQNSASVPRICISAIMKRKAIVGSAKSAFKALAHYFIEVISVDFKRQRGAYKVLMRNRFIFIKNDLHPVMESIVMLHEIGHDVLHRKEAVKAGGFKEFNIFNMRENRMEYEANVFASQVSLDDEEILEYIHYGYDIQRIASAMHTDANLVALKTDALIAQGYCLHHQEYENRFLK